MSTPQPPRLDSPRDLLLDDLLIAESLGEQEAAQLLGANLEQAFAAL